MFLPLGERIIGFTQISRSFWNVPNGLFQNFLENSRSFWNVPPWNIPEHFRPATIVGFTQISHLDSMNLTRFT